MADGAPVGVGPIACISPWNFPLVIVTGQIAAALVTGNTVLAKPAEQTPLMAARAVQLMHQAVRDIIASAFTSAGQRCSALRILAVQEDIADSLLAMLEGAAQALRLGDPWDAATDVGPVAGESGHRLPLPAPDR